MAAEISRSLSFEKVGDEVLVHDPEGGFVVRLEGSEAAVIRQVLDGDTGVDLTSPAARRLSDAGLIEVAEPATTNGLVSRRTALRLTAATAAAAGFVVIALPGAAAAASEGPGPGPGPTTTTTPLPAPPAGINGGLTGLSYPPGGEGGGGNTVGIRWQQGGAAAPFTYSATFSGPGITTFTVGGLSSSSDYTNISIPGWDPSVELTVQYNTEGYSPNVAGTSRTATRPPAAPTGIDPGLTGISYPPADNDRDAINVRWDQGGASGSFTYVATFSGPGITPFSVTLTSTSDGSYSRVEVPDWAAGVELTVSFATTGYDTEIEGTTRTETKYPAPPAGIQTSLTGIQYPPDDEDLNAVDIRWRRGTAVSNFTYLATFRGTGITTFTVGPLTSSATYTKVPVPNWAVGVELNVDFITTGYSPNVVGDTKDQTRIS